MKFFTAALAALLVAGFAGCAATRGPVGRQKVVSSIPDDKPDWVGKASYEDDDRIFYSGGVTGRTDMALGLREARGEAEKQLAEQVRQRIRTEFGSAIEGQNVDGELGSYVKDLIAKISDEVQVSGVSQSGQFVEKLEENTHAGVRYLWDCHALLSITKADYLEAREATLNGAVARAKKARNAKAETALKEAFQKLEAAKLAPEPDDAQAPPAQVPPAQAKPEPRSGQAPATTPTAQPPADRQAVTAAAGPTTPKP